MKQSARGAPWLQLEHFVPYRLSLLTNTVSRSLARHYAERFDLTIPQWRVMAVLGPSPGLSAGEVVERTAMDKVAVSRAVSGLVAAGRARRAADPTDGRRSRLFLTARGGAIYQRIVPLARDFERRLLSPLAPGELRALDRLLSRLQERADQLEPDRGRPPPAPGRAAR